MPSPAAKRITGTGAYREAAAVALTACARFEEAAEAFAAAVRLAPDLADAWANLGVAR